MSCEVAGSPFSEPGADTFDSSTHQADKVDLSPISEFNSDYSGIHCVNPQNLSNAGSPSYNPNATLTPDFAPDAYPHDFGSTPASPYFPSVEQSLAAPFTPQLLPNQHLHRRSVSEPPDGSLMHHLPQQENPVFFHRDGHSLGMPRSNGLTDIKKVKQSRVQPYGRPQRQPPPAPQSRYQLRRAYTHSSRLPPTSVPIGMHINTPAPPQQQQQMRHRQQHHAMPSSDPELQFVSSRVCTPAPEAIDPFLPSSPAPEGPQFAAHGVPHVRNPGFVQSGVQGRTQLGSKSVVIKMGVDELRALITEVVQKAMEGSQTCKKGPEEVILEDVDDEIVVAGCSNEEVGE